MFVIPDDRTGFSMKIDGVRLTRPDLHILAADLGIKTKDVLVENGVLTIFNTSDECQEIIDDNALVSFVAMTLSISPDDISELTAVKAIPKVIEKASYELEDDDDED
ncbi:hypothetical protein GJV85_02450 [Sulfurimonas aquatica]|uniref:Uncharacterized protein n=1 Tax=Sulfurimonas aquatica TaxID=2672570 RepID=A0A975AYV1_9BACT|nr:hypothetical protein [Sulfurimonas aquatica]QSZ41020.1 hypothetical protein GJV85_02450 [Sulfurimonas aquatica]